MRVKAISIFNKILEGCLWGIIFFLPFSKAGIEICLSLAFLVWVVKRIILGLSVVEGKNKFSIISGLKPFFKAFRFTPAELNKPVYVLILINFISVVSGLHWGLGLEGIVGKLYSYIFIFFLTQEVISGYSPLPAQGKQGAGSNESGGMEGRFARILGVFLFSIALIAADGIFQHVTGKDFIRGFYSSSPRLRASLCNPNDFAGWLVLVLPVLLSVLFLKADVFNKTLRIVRGIALLAVLCSGIFCLIFTFSRGAWIGYGAGMIFIILTVFLDMFCWNKTARDRDGQNKRGKDRGGKGGLMGLAAGLLLIVPLFAGLIFSSGIKARLVSIGDVNYVRTQQRLVLWKEALAIVEDFPVLGTGPNTYAVVAPRYKLRENTGFYPHNSYLHMAAETGILGLTAFLWVIISFFRAGIAGLRGRRGKSKAVEQPDEARQTVIEKEKAGPDVLLLGIMAGVLGFLVHSFFDTNLYAMQLAVLFWFALGLGAVRMKT